MKKINNFEKERKKLENYIYFTFSDQNLIHILKDLIWGIIKYKEEKKEDSIKSFGEFCEHSHLYLFSNLNKFMTNKIYLKSFPNPKNWEIVDELQNMIFPEFNIQNIDLIKETRIIVEHWNDFKHEYNKKRMPSLDNLKILSISINCIKLFLLVRQISYISKNYTKKYPKNFCEKLKDKKIDIENDFVLIFQGKNKEILNIFLDNVFGRKNRDLIIKNHILSSNDIQNSRILQNYYPIYIFAHWRIEEQLYDNQVQPFRPIGPYLIDFEKGDWIYISKIAKYIVKHLKKYKKSILISAIGGTGKTVISRWIGYSFYIKGFNVFYIDCLEHKAKKIEAVLDQLIIHHESGAKRLSEVLFIFENIHILDKELKFKLSKNKDSTLCLLTERIFEEKESKKKNMSQYFDSFQKIKISMNHWTFKNTIKGILTLNSKNIQITRQLQYLGNQNLWIYAILLKLFKESLEFKEDSSIIDIFINHKLIGEKISDYFNDLLKMKVIKFRSSEDTLYLNHIHYFLGILSIFSEYELWTESKFIDFLISIKDETALGGLNSDININKDILNDIQAFLIDIFEVSERSVDFRTSIKEKEYKIPHSQMAIIYKNCILKLYENIYPGLIKQLKYLYISYGKYYGSLLEQTYLSRLIVRESRNINEINKTFFDFNSYLEHIKYLGVLQNNSSLEIIKDQILNQSIEENNQFFHYINLYDNNLKREIFQNTFQNESLLFNPIWKYKILESKPSILFFLLYQIKKYLDNTLFLDFIREFKVEILNKFEEDDRDYIFRFMQLFSKIKKNIWSDFHESIINFLDKRSIEVESFQSFYFINHRFFDNINENHIFYTPIQNIFEKLIHDTSLEIDSKFIPSINNPDLKLFSQYYLNIIERMLNQNSQSKHALVNLFERKLQDSSLYKVINFIEDLYENNSKLALRFFTKFMNIIKNKLYTTDVADLEDFFSTLTNFLKDEKDFIESAFLSDWDWFKGIFSRLTTGEFFYFSKFRIITHFFEELFPNYLQRYNEFYISLGKSRIKEFYEGLNCKIDIYNKLSNILEDELNILILDLFNESIYESLKTQNLNFYIEFFTKFYSPFGFSILRDKWDSKKFITTNRFKEILSKAEDNELKEFFNIFWKGDSWKEILFEIYNDFLIKRFGENFKKILKVSEEQIQYLDNLKNHIRKLEIAEIIKTYNHYSDPLFPHKKAYEFIYFRKFLEERQDNLLSHEFETKLNLLEFSEILNFLAILKIYHPNIVKKFYEKYNEIIYQKSRDNSSEVIEILTILEFYKLDIGFLKELDGYTNEEFSLFQMILECLTEIDLCTLRYLFQNNPADFLKNYTNINISNHLKHSSLLQLSIFLYKEELKVAQKNPGYTYLRKMSFMGGHVQKFPFVLELLEIDFINIKKKFEPILILDFHYRNYKKDRITFLKHNNLLTKLISNQFIPFTSDITELIRKSEICLISLYLKSLTKILDDLEKNKLKIPENLEKYFISEDFKDKIKNAEFYDIYRLFKYLKTINFGLSREIWKRNKSYFEDVEFSIKLKNEYSYRIFKFYDMFNDAHFKFSLESIEILKKAMRLKPLETIIPYFLEILSNDDFNKLISTFKEELNNIAKNYSKFELKKMLSEHFMRKYNQDSLSIMNVIFKERLDEKYFFES